MSAMVASGASLSSMNRARFRTPQLPQTFDHFCRPESQRGVYKRPQDEQDDGEEPLWAVVLDMLILVW